VVCETIIVVPCYNEAARLDVAAFGHFVRAANGTSLLFVDDGSSDDTPRVLEQLRAQYPARISVFRVERNGGKAAAVRRGVLVALRQRPAFVGYWDADLATPLDVVPKFRAVLDERPEIALVMGSRVPLLGRQIHRRRTRQLLGRAFATAASWVLRLPVFDTQCGAKLFRVNPTTSALFQHPFRSRWIFDVEILARMMATTPHADEAIYEFPLDRWEDVAGSRLRLRDFAAAALDLAAIRWRYGGDRSPAAELPASQPAIASQLPVEREAA
jgi:glycosyltransferase involved in cell wall biosynthesis